MKKGLCEKHKGVKGPKYKKVKKVLHKKLIHKLHLTEQEEKEILSTNVLYLCSEWVSHAKVDSR